MTNHVFSLLLVKDNSSESTQFFTKECVEDVVNKKDESIVFAAADLVPQLTVVYSKKKTATGVEQVTVRIPATLNDKVYTLQGILVNERNLPAGIYVKNGKKFFVK